MITVRTNALHILFTRSAEEPNSRLFSFRITRCHLIFTVMNSKRDSERSSFTSNKTEVGPFYTSYLTILNITNNSPTVIRLVWTNNSHRGLSNPNRKALKSVAAAPATASANPIARNSIEGLEVCTYARRPIPDIVSPLAMSTTALIA